MLERNSKAIWEGSLQEGRGRIELGSKTLQAPYSFQSRFGSESHATNPEELLGAAHAACFSMALSNQLGQAGFRPRRIETHALVRLGKEGSAFRISSVTLRTQVEVPSIGETEFLKLAQMAKTNCPVSRALSGTEIHLEATLVATVAPDSKGNPSSI